MQKKNNETTTYAAFLFRHCLILHRSHWSSPIHGWHLVAGGDLSRDMFLATTICHKWMKQKTSACCACRNVALSAHHWLTRSMFPYVSILSQEVPEMGGTPIAGWFIEKIPIKRMIWGYPYFRKSPYMYTTVKSILQSPMKLVDIKWLELTKCSWNNDDSGSFWRIPGKGRTPRGDNYLILARLPDSSRAQAYDPSSFAPSNYSFSGQSYKDLQSTSLKLKSFDIWNLFSRENQ